MEEMRSRFKIMIPLQIRKLEQLWFLDDGVFPDRQDVDTSDSDVEKRSHDRET